MTRLWVVISSSPLTQTLFPLPQVKGTSMSLQMVSMWLKVKLLEFSKKRDVFHFMIIFLFLQQGSRKSWKQPSQSPGVSPSVGDCNQLVIKTCARQLGAALTQQ